MGLVTLTQPRVIQIYTLDSKVFKDDHFFKYIIGNALDGTHILLNDFKLFKYLKLLNVFDQNLVFISSWVV